MRRAGYGSQLSVCLSVTLCPFSNARGDSEVVSRARPSHSTAFSSYSMNTRKEGLAHCLYRFRSTSQDVGWPIRLQNVNDVTYLNVSLSSIAVLRRLVAPVKARMTNLPSFILRQPFCHDQTATNWDEGRGPGFCVMSQKDYIIRIQRVPGIGSGPDPPSACLYCKN